MISILGDIIQAPAVAESLAAMILGQTPPIDISAFNLQVRERFDTALALIIRNRSTG